MNRGNRFSNLIVWLVVSSALFAQGWASGQEVRSVAELGTLGGERSCGFDVSEHGIVVGSSYVDDDRYHAFLWDNGRMIDLGTLGGPDSEALAVNKAGQVVGRADIPEGYGRAFLWQDGEMVDLNDLIGRQGKKWTLFEAADINAKGHIVGQGRYIDGQGPYGRAFLMKLARRNKVINLGMLEGDRYSRAYGVNKYGQVVGTSGYRGFLWEDGEMIDLGDLGGGDTQALAINDAGQVVGHSETVDDDTHAFLWTKETGMIDLGTLGGQDSYASDITNDGMVVGWSRDPDGDYRVFIWRDGVMTDLNDLLPEGFDMTLTLARGVNTAGQVVGQGRSYGCKGDAPCGDGYVATPVCENVKEIKLDCFRGDAVQATIKTRLPNGSIFGVEHNGEGRQLVQVNARGRAEAEWLRQSGVQKVCIEGCPGVCATVECLPPPEQYMLVDLGTLPGGGASGAYSINVHGQTVGSARTPHDNSHAVLWEDDWIIDLGTLGGEYSSAHDINDNGLVVGTAYTSEEKQRAFLWEKGVMKNLGTLGGDYSTARGVNCAVQVVGLAEDETGYTAAFLWENGEMIDIGSLGGEQSQAYDINEAVQITGYSYDPAGNMRGFFWSDGGPMRDIGTLGGDECWPRAINDSAQIVGSSSSHAFLWTEKDGMIDLGTLPGGASPGAYDINNAGQVVGAVTFRSNKEHHAFIWQDGIMTDLNDLVPAGCAWDYLNRGSGINDHGEIVGSARRGEFDYAAFLMTHAYCGDIRDLKVSCNRKNKLVARLVTTYRPGTVLTLSNNGEDAQCVIIDAVGRGKARWCNQAGQHEICVEQCRDLCESVDCP